jgi:hypothetical protein
VSLRKNILQRLNGDVVLPYASSAPFTWPR